MFLMSWTRTRSRVERSRRDGRVGFSFIPSRSTGVVEVNFHGQPGPEDRLGDVPLDLDDDLEGPAGGVHRRADVLHDTGGAGPGELLRDHVHAVAPADTQEAFLRQVDPGEQRLEGRDLEEWNVLVVDHLLADARVLLGNDARERRPNEGVVPDRTGLLPGRGGHGIARFLLVELRLAHDAA